MSNKPPKTELVPDPKEMFYTAVEFEDAHNVLGEVFGDRVDTLPEAHPRTPSGSPIIRFGRTLWFPIIINGAFALELYFKCLHVLDNGEKSKQRHKVRAIFFDLKPATQTRIKLHFELISAAFLVRNNDEPLPGDDFDTVLQDADNAFVKWRYHFEPDETTGKPEWPGDRWFAPNLIQAARRVILERHPEWRKYADHLYDEPTPPVPNTPE